MEAVKTSGIKKHIPNIISFIRIVGAFSLPFLMWERWERNITLPFFESTFYNVPFVWVIVYFILASSDKLDGTLARKFKVESDLGAALDVLGDALIIVIGATLCFVWFVGDSLERWQFWLYVGIMFFCVLNKVLVFMLAKIYHGNGNTVHTYLQKVFAVACFISIFFWAFLRTIPEWSIFTLLAINIIATVDESVYCIRSESYSVNFKGHWFEKYKVRVKG